MGVDIDPVIQVPGCIFIGSYRDLAQRQIYSLCKYQQNDKGETEQSSC